MQWCIGQTLRTTTTRTTATVTKLKSTYTHTLNYPTPFYSQNLGTRFHCHSDHFCLRRLWKHWNGISAPGAQYPGIIFHGAKTKKTGASFLVSPNTGLTSFFCVCFLISAFILFWIHFCTGESRRVSIYSYVQFLPHHLKTS